jgi:hypothetical protein
MLPGFQILEIAGRNSCCSIHGCRDGLHNARMSPGILGQFAGELRSLWEGRQGADKRKAFEGIQQAQRQSYLLPG